jgi:hypothetical protein
VIVYRIQNSQGRGPFKPGFSERWVDNNRTYFHDAHIKEMIKVKKLAAPDLKLAFACKSIEDLQKWVNKAEYEKLKKFGYYAISLEVEYIWPLDGEIIVGRKKPYQKGVMVINLYPVKQGAR